MTGKEIGALNSFWLISRISNAYRHRWKKRVSSEESENVAKMSHLLTAKNALSADLNASEKVNNIADHRRKYMEIKPVSGNSTPTATTVNNVCLPTTVSGSVSFPSGPLFDTTTSRNCVVSHSHHPVCVNPVYVSDSCSMTCNNVLVSEVFHNINLPTQYCQNNIVKLIGEKPLIKFCVNGKLYEGLWDTGSMVSLVSTKWLREEFPEQKVFTIQSFTDSDETISLRAANNSELPLEGIAMLDFMLPSSYTPYKIRYAIKTRKFGSEASCSFFHFEAEMFLILKEVLTINIDQVATLSTPP